LKKSDIDSLDPKKFIIIKGARVHNLKNLDVAIPRNNLVVITGLSGSGKSSLAFDTLFAEGQRRYVESLSSYARQFIGRMDKPDVDYIRGIAPAIAIEQKVNTRNPRSTVGTSTEIYDFLKLLFARIGKTYSPISGKLVKRDTISDVTDTLNKYPDGTKIIIYSPVHIKPHGSLVNELKALIAKGFTRVQFNNKLTRIDDLLKDETFLANHPDVKVTTKKPKKEVPNTDTLNILIDRLVIDKKEEDTRARISDSLQTAFFEGDEKCIVEIIDEQDITEIHTFSNRFEMDGITFEDPSVHLFSFNNPFGACKTCEGFGTIVGIDENLIIPDKSLSVYDGAIVCWRGEKMKEWNDKLVMNAYKFDFPIHRPYWDLTTEDKHLLWTGNLYFEGLNAFFKYLEAESYKIQYRVMLSRYRGKTICPDCKGSRLRKDASYVHIDGKSIIDLVLMSCKDLLPLFSNLKLDTYDKIVSERLLVEIVSRLQFMNDVGLGYLSLNRLSNTLSGGESQRINLATSLGSSLVGSMYILDEPSIGLHSKDTQQLIKVLKSLRNLGNTVIVVEHDEEIMRASDQLIDIGPLAGTEGGELVFQGTFDTMIKDTNSLTAKYLKGFEKIPVPQTRRKWNKYIMVEGARENNLKGITVKFPLDVMTVVTGVSGSGKTSLVKKVLYTSLKKIYGGISEQSGLSDRLSGDINNITNVEMVDQNPIGKSSRSNPVTYIKAYDDIRELYAAQPLSKTRGFKPSFFSFNVDGGRCEMCQGEGEVTIEMQFMPDIHLQCETCGGKRFKEEILDIIYKEKNISDLLHLTVDDALKLFETKVKPHTLEEKIVTKLQYLSDVGLGYVQLGQSSSTLSGGEAQRIKLASFLSKGNNSEHILFIFDEPTTGLHFHDIKKLLKAFDALIAQGNSILIIEHNPEVIKCADWVIDLGPEGGDEGGNLVFEGTPENLVNCKESYTAEFLKDKLEGIKI